MTVPKFQKMKTRHEKITMITCYDHPSACIIDETAIDLILVGDSVAMVVHGAYNGVVIFLKLAEYEF